MTFAWLGYLLLAEALTRQPDNPGPEEACLRSAISRAYYAAYGEARKVAHREGANIRHRGSDHGVVKMHFETSPLPDRRNIGINLGRLYAERNNADYDDVLNGHPTSQAEYAIATARYILTSLETL